MQTFLDKFDLPSLSEADRDTLGADITCAELLTIIGLIKNSKSPDPDGISNEIYKKFGRLLVPYTVGQGWNTSPNADRSQYHLPKKWKDLKVVGSYRPISLLNSDQKILAKVLARRLGVFMCKMIHIDQTGFTPQRNSFHNFRRLLNIIHSSKLPQKDLMILSLDAEKAFDRVEWAYLFSVLPKFNCGDKFVSWTKLLYNIIG